MSHTNYTSEEIHQKVYSVVSEVSGIEVSELNSTLSVNDDIAPRSLDRVTLFMALEDEFSASVEEEELQDLVSLGDLVSYVERKAGLTPG